MVSQASTNREPRSQDSGALSLRRRRLLAQLTAARGELVWQILDLDAEILTQSPVFQGSDWTAQDLLAHVAAWDRWQHQAMAALLEGTQPDFSAAADWDQFNAAAVEARRDHTLAEVLNEMREVRSAWMVWIQEVPLEPFFEPREVEGWDWAFPGCLRIQWEHDAEHAAELAEWRSGRTLQDAGPKAVLEAALLTARDELVTATHLFAPDERSSRPVCGQWTLKDVVGHQADWEQVGVMGLRHMSAGRPPDIDPIPDVESWNAEHAAARRDHTWQTCWADIHATREALLKILETTSQETLERTYPFPWGQDGTAYQWVRVFVEHDREHAADLRDAAGLREVTGAQRAAQSPDS